MTGLYSHGSPALGGVEASGVLPRRGGPSYSSGAAAEAPPVLDHAVRPSLGEMPIVCAPGEPPLACAPTFSSDSVTPRAEAQPPPVYTAHWSYGQVPDALGSMGAPACHDNDDLHAVGNDEFDVDPSYIYALPGSGDLEQY